MSLTHADTAQVIICGDNANDPKRTCGHLVRALSIACAKMHCNFWAEGGQGSVIGWETAVADFRDPRALLAGPFVEQLGAEPETQAVLRELRRRFRELKDHTARWCQHGATGIEHLDPVCIDRVRAEEHFGHR